MKETILQLRDAMTKHGVDITIIPTGDFHGSEYIHPHFKARAYLSGFTGSAGVLAVTAKEARLWTDGRYFLQARMQLAESGIELMKQGEQGVPSLPAWLTEVLQSGQTLSFDGRIVNWADGNAYAAIAKKKGADIVYETDLAEEIWKERPPLSGKPVKTLPLSSTGLSFTDKLAQVRQKMQSGGFDHLLLTSLEENAWLYNLRGDDVACTPVFFAFTLITPTEVRLYAFKEALADTTLPEGITLHDYFSLPADLKELPPDAVLLADPQEASYSLVCAAQSACRLILASTPISLLKAVKNDVEIASTRRAHVQDGVAMVNFLYWLKKNVGTMPLSEISAGKYLESMRAAAPDFWEPSFETIAGYMENGAIIHYTATTESNRQLQAKGFFLVDSGGQYESGTTDITRTIALGTLTEEMKTCYTAVLRAHIDLVTAKFTPGTTGQDLDPIARKPLQEIGLDFNHGTGHGVGHVLSVHEGPQTISKKRPAPVQTANTKERLTILPAEAQAMLPGMITSDEPGVYLEGKFGIRIENEMLCIEVPRYENIKDKKITDKNKKGTDSLQSDKSSEEPDSSKQDKTYGFDFLTLCPYEPAAILPELLTDEELSFLNAYHARVNRTLSPLLAPDVAAWLAEETKPIQK